MSINIRRIVVSVERSFHEGGPRLKKPVKRGWAAAIIENPFANRYVEDLVPFMESLEPLAYDLTVDLLEALKLTPSEIDSYGKGAIVGLNGEMEHAAIWHGPGGAGLRRGVQGGTAGVPGTMKYGAPGTTIDMSLGNMDVINVRSHYDTISVNLGDSPKPNEIAYIVGVSDSGRPHARLGSLVTAEDARKQSGRK